MKRGVLQLVLAFCLLFAGGITYVLFRPDTTLLFCALTKLGAAETLYHLRTTVEIELPYWVVYCLPNALWVCAYILIADMVLTGWSNRTKLIVSSLIMTIGVASEMMQSAGILPGTFDFADIVAYVSPYILYVALIITKNKIVLS